MAEYIPHALRVKMLRLWCVKIYYAGDGRSGGGLLFKMTPHSPPGHAE